MADKRIICWGDSITVGMAMKDNETYPAVLQRLLGENYTVINAGGGGETAQTIAARQGAYKVYTAKDICFAKGENAADIGMHEYKMAFCLEDGTLLNTSLHPNPFSPYEFESDLVYIETKEYFLPKNGKQYLLKRDDSEEAKVIQKGAEVVFLSALEQRKGSFCEIFYIGTNGRVSGVPATKDINFLIEQNKRMIERHGNERYLVIIPYWSSYYTEAFIKEFGEKAVDFRSLLLECGAESEGLVPTDLDLEKIKKGEIPPMFRLNNNPNDIHLNKHGYSFLAKMLHTRGRKSGYWD